VSASIAYKPWDRLAARFPIWHLATEITTAAPWSGEIRWRVWVRCTIRTSIDPWEGLDPKCSRAPQRIQV